MIERDTVLRPEDLSPDDEPVGRYRHFGIVVGIDRYPGYRDLSSACADAESFAGWLSDPSGGDVPAGNVRVHYGRESADVGAARPIKRDIDVSLHEWTKEARSAPRPSRLWLYFAGHGVAAGLGTSAVLMADAQPGLCWNLSLSPYRNWLDRCRDFTEVVLVVDCCRSIATEVPEGLPPYDTCSQPSTRPHRAFVALAADLGHEAFESSERGQFTAILLDGLRGQAADPLTGDIRAETMATFLDSAMAARSSPPQRAETSIIGKPLVLTSSANASTFEVTVVLSPGTPRTVEVLGPSEAVVAAVHLVGGEWTIGLARGLYELNDPLSGSLLFKVDGPGVVVRS